MADAAQSRPIEDVREISAITYGFMASKALFSALEFDVFTHIAQGADSTSALAAVTGVAENRLLTLLAALKSVGLVSEAGGRLINAPATSRYLVAGAPGDFRDYVRYVNGAFGYESFRHLDEALRGDRIFPDKGWYEGLVYEGGIGGERFSSAQHTGSLGPARLMAKRVDLKDPRDRRYGQAICARGRTRRSDRASRGQRGRRRLAGGTRRHPHVLRLERSRRG
jgi:2-hydroxy-4-(methylsulfanyl)butanoate S-methyltransferase